jgi:phage terminase large subunit-like protein
VSDVTIFHAIQNPELFRPWFRDPVTWAAWFAFLRALFGLPMSEAERRMFETCTGLREPPVRGSQEAWLICGRRSGKSFALALIAVFLAAFRDWRPYLAPGERGTVMIVAADRRQSRVIYRFANALLRNVPALAAMIERETAESIDLNNQVTVEILTASFRTVRGYTLVAALCDELAFWRSEESTNPDEEILAAIRPAMATIPGAIVVRQLSLLAPGRVMECLPPALRQAGLGANLARRHPDDEPDCSTIPD